MDQLPTKEELLSIFDYDPQTGVLHRKNGAIAGCKRKDKYLVTNVSGRLHYVHRIVWKLLYGNEPSLIDHIDRDPGNNRPGNLRKATKQQNALNANHNRGESGVKGVIKSRTPGKWIAQISIAGHREQLGTFNSVIEAELAYKAKAADLHLRLLPKPPEDNHHVN